MTSRFLRSNAQKGGLADHGAPLQATYVAACEGDRMATAAYEAIGFRIVGD